MATSGAARSVLVIGAGIVGLSVALALQERGQSVTLVGEDIPGQGASIWNAGVLATSSLLPMSNPAIFRQLPAILTGRHPGVVIDWGAGPSLVPWALRFLWASRTSAVAPRVAALSALIARSARQHAAWLARADLSSALVAKGWIFLYRRPEDLRSAQAAMAFYQRHGVACRLLEAEAVRQAEPALARPYAAGLIFDGTSAAREPAEVLAAYLALFRAAGGQVVQKKVVALSRQAAAEGVRFEDGSALAATDVVVATGARSRALLSGVFDLPMMSERGYALRLRITPDRGLTRPVYDSAVGLVLSPRPDGIQLSTGSHLTRPGRPILERPAAQARRHACAILGIDDQPGITVRHGDRPTLPDGLPVVGQVPGRPGLWLATGHQHIGFSTSAGTAELLADLFTGQAPKLDPAPFRPERLSARRVSTAPG